MLLIGPRLLVTSIKQYWYWKALIKDLPLFFCNILNVLNQLILDCSDKIHIWEAEGFWTVSLMLLGLMTSTVAEIL